MEHGGCGRAVCRGTLGSVKQVVIAFAFRLAALLVRQIFRRDNAFYICAGMHFFYNLMVFFVISI